MTQTVSGDGATFYNHEIMILKVDLHLKTSFEPLDCSDAEILILGSIPGDRSIKVQEYYGHPQNRFWRVLARITNSDTPSEYAAKKAMLNTNKIALWDVAHHANRIGSMDSAIRDEESNDISHFIDNHPNLKVLAFNGKKAEQLYDKFFERAGGIVYLSLPSTSPANAACNLENLCQLWCAIL